MRRIFVLILSVLALALAACSSGATNSTLAAQPITVEASEFKFEPATIEVATGRLVKMTMRNKGTVEHDWAIMTITTMGMKESSSGRHDMSHTADKPDLHVNAMTGRSAEVEFTPSQPGTYQIICTVAGHKEAGMVGTLVVK